MTLSSHFWLSLLTLVQVLGSTLVSIGASGLLGYLLQAEVMANWYPGGTPMALPTTVAFVLSGISFFILACAAKKEIRHREASRRAI